MIQLVPRAPNRTGPGRAALLTLLACIACHLAAAADSPCPTDSLPEAPDLSQARPIELPVLGEIERTVARMRGLPFLKPVSYVTLDRQHLREVLLHEMLRSYSTEELRLEGIAYEVLGFVPHGTGEKLAETYLGLLEEQIGAFYEPVNDLLVTMEESHFQDFFSRVLLAHELVHAIDDQHFHLECYPLDQKGDDDRILAISALVEGNATRLMNEFAVTDTLDATLDGGTREFDIPAFSSERLNEAPVFLREILTFPYFGGQKFTEDLYQFGGYPLVNLAFKSPPQTTEQVLHPQKFYPRPEPAAPISPLPEPPAGWKRIAENTAGELGLRLLFTVYLDAFRAVAPAMGWGGDRWAVYALDRPQGEGEGEDAPTAASHAFDWRLAWDTAADCDEFLAAYRELARVRFEDELRPGTGGAGDASSEATTPAGTLRLEREDERHVLLRFWPAH